MDLKYAHQCCVKIIGLRLFGVENLNVIGSTGDTEDFAVEKVAGELLSL